MKFKFVPEVQKIIDTIAALPDKLTGNDELLVPGKLIRDLETYLNDNKGQEGSKISPTEWVKVRRQLAFLSALTNWLKDIEEVSRVSIEAEKKMMGKDVIPPEKIKKVSIDALTRLFIQQLKQIQNGKALTNKSVLRLGIDYGVVYMSDHELQGLIDRNKV